MGWLREQTAGYREERRKGRKRMAAEGLKPPPWYEKLFVRLVFVLGVYLLIWGDTVERILGGSVVALNVGIWTWVVVKVLREGKWRSND